MTGLNPDIRSHIQSIINSVAILRTFLYGLVDLLWWDGAVWYEMKCFGFSVTFCEYKQRQCPWLTVLSVFGLLLNVYLIPRITDYPSRRADKHIFQDFCFQSSVFWMEGFVLSLDKFHFISYHPPSSHHQLINQAIKKGSQNAPLLMIDWTCEQMSGFKQVVIGKYCVWRNYYPMGGIYFSKYMHCGARY